MSEPRERTLPDDVYFSNLLAVADRLGHRTVVDDRSRGTQFGYPDILNGTLMLKHELQNAISPAVLAKRGEFFVALLAPNGYEFIIGVLATLALGGVIVPVPVGALPAEAAYIIRFCQAQAMLVGPEQIQFAAEIGAEVSIPSIAIPAQAADPTTLAPVSHYQLDATLAMSEDTPSILFFTSGTTGPPKGVLHARRTIYKYARAMSIEAEDEVCVIPRGVFWSIYFTKLFQMLLRGVRIEIQNFGRNYEMIWENFRAKTTTKIVLSPTFWHGLMLHYNTHIMKLSEEERRDYVEGFRYLRDVSITGAMPSVALKQFWKGLRGGRPLKVQYGTTETQEIAVVYENEYSEEADLGTPLPGVTLKLSHGTEGEILVKTPSLFLGYLHAPEDTAEKLDSDGFFKTGDLAVEENGRIIFKGRANMDLFKFYTYKVPRLQVEHHLLALPYVTEGYILPVEDPQCDTRVAAVVRVRDPSVEVNLSKIRSDLSRHMPSYQLPTVLRILKDCETVPCTWSDKTAMKRAIHLYFPRDAEHRLLEIGVEVMNIDRFMEAPTQNMWDRSGMR